MTDLIRYKPLWVYRSTNIDLKGKKMVKSSCYDNGVKKGAWSEDEDTKLRAYIQRYGHWNWGLLPKFAGIITSRLIN